MATFKEIFAKKRAELGAGKTFVWPKSEGGDGKSYSTDYATEKKSSGTKPKAKPAGLNPQSGAARSTAGKVKPASTVKRPAKADEISGQKAAPSLSGASRSTAGKVAPKMSMMDKAKADAKARREASQSAGRGNKNTAPPVTVPTAAVKPLTKLMQILSQGGFSKYTQKK
jgi:hypothetical protein